MLISHSHDGTVGHLGDVKTVKRLRTEFYWKTMVDDTKKYVDSCHLCQTRKSSPTKRYGKNHPLPTPGAPWDHVSMDFLVNLPSSALNGLKFNSLFVVEDYLSKQAHLIPTTTNVTAEGVAKLYFDWIYRLHGLPRAIVLDRDTKFTGAFWRRLQKMVGTDLMMSTTDHPQTDGQMEKTNRTVLQTLRMYVNQVGSDWTQHLATVEFAINSAVSRSTGKAPFEIIYGFLPRSFPPIAFDQDNPASMNFMEDRMLAQMSAQDAIIAAKTEQSYHVNKHRKEDPDFEKGENVVVLNESQLSHLPKGRQKLATKWVGPYKVLKVDKETSNYTIKIPNSKRHPTFHVGVVKKYIDPQLDLFPNRQRRQPRIVTSEVDLNVEVSKLIGHQKRRDGSIQFLVLWEGYPEEDATYRDAVLFGASPYGVRVVEDYLGTFGELPEELDAWVRRTEWVWRARKAEKAPDGERELKLRDAAGNAEVTALAAGSEDELDDDWANDLWDEILGVRREAIEEQEEGEEEWIMLAVDEDFDEGHLTPTR
jgi:transposase InsO family protein